MVGHELEEMYAESCPHCFRKSLEEFIRSEYLRIGSVFKDAIGDIKAGQVDDAKAKLSDVYTKNLNKAVGQVFKDTDGDEYWKFKASATRFGTYKSEYVAKILENALQKRPENFDTNAKGIIKTFNRYQVTEYNTAIARSRTAKQWVAFRGVERKKALPNLVWLRTQSATPREVHLGYVGLVLPKDHPFWIENYPGNVYGCKCDWRDTAGEPTPELDREDIVPPSKGIRQNPGRTRQLFSDDHTYFRAQPARDKARIDNRVTDTLLSDFIQRNGYAIHPATLQDKGNDFAALVRAAKLLGEHEGNVYIMPKISHFDNDWYRYLYRGMAKNNSCPDLLVNGVLWELEGYDKTTTKKQWSRVISSMLARGAKQSENIILDIRGADITVESVRTMVMGRLSKSEKISRVMVLTDKGLENVL